MLIAIIKNLKISIAFMQKTEICILLIPASVNAPIGRGLAQMQ